MTQKKKLIVGAVVVLVAYYLYDRNRKMKVVSDLKAGAETIVAENIDVPTIINKGIPQPAQSKSDLNFYGSVKGQYFR